MQAQTTLPQKRKAERMSSCDIYSFTRGTGRVLMKNILVGGTRTPDLWGRSQMAYHWATVRLNLVNLVYYISINSLK